MLNRRNASLVCLLSLLLIAGISMIAQAEEEIVFWTFLNPADQSPRSQVQTQLIEEFERQNPGVKVNVQIVAWNEIAPRLIQAVNSGRGPDVVRIASDSWEQQIDADTLLPIDQFVDEAYKQDWLLPWEFGVNENGERVAIWIEHRVVSLYYREDLLAEVGETVPTTWSDLGRIAGKLTEKGYVGFTVGLSQGGAGNGLMECYFKPVIWAAGGYLLDENGRAAFNGPAGHKAMQLLYDLVHTYKAIPQETLVWDVDGMFQGIQAGRVGMSLFATHRVATARQSEAVGESIKVAPVPGFDGRPSPAHVTGWTLAIPNTCKDPELGWKFIDHMTSTEAQILNAKVAGELPARKSAYDDPWFQEDPFGREMVEWKAYIDEYGRIPQFPAEYLYLHSVLVEAAQKIVQGNVPIEQALNEAAEKYNSRVR
ncbi:MAG: sugar ABC transporter substrate-binding protein [Firmicutes bacterium]|nr:sugar ABC transporter substrate-binding protein [Bacillota bacterium]